MPSFSEAVQDCLQHDSDKAAQIVLQYLIQERAGVQDKELIAELLIKSIRSELKLACMLHMASHRETKDQLGILLSLDTEQIEAIARTQPLKAKFPAVNALATGCIAEVLLYPFASVNPRCVVLQGKNYRELNWLAALTGTSCLIGFSKAIEGDSWQLAAVAALIGKGVVPLDNLAFSGVVSGEGKVLSADELEQKQNCCRRANLNLVHRVQSISHLGMWLNEDPIPLPIVQLQGSKEDLEMWQGKLEDKLRQKYAWFSYTMLEDMYGISTDDLAIFGEGKLEFKTETWQQLLAQKVIQRFDTLEYRLKPRKILWYYAGQISTLQLGIGAIFGFKRAISILQLDFSNGEYREVFALYGKNNARELKNVSIKAEECQMVEGQLLINDAKSKQLGLIIYLGSHNPIGEAKDYCRNSLRVNNFLIIKAIDNQGVLELNEDWLRLAQEINSLLNWAREEYAWQRIHLFITAPTALCMALGIAMGHFLPVDVYHYQYGAGIDKYKRMFSMDAVLGYQGGDF